MGYFNNPRTEEELDNQCRALLKKYNYRSGQSNPTIEKILQEYKSLKMQIKRANGYRTPTEELVSFAKGVANDSKQKRETEQARVRELQNHKYSKTETEQLISECKKCIDIMIKTAVQEEKLGYIALEKNVLLFDPEYITRWFNRNTNIIIEDTSLIKRYDNAREKLEYALKSSAQNKRTAETYMIQMEKSLGNYIKTKFKEYQDIYADPIKIAQKEQSVKQNEKARSKWHFATGIELGFLPAIPIFLIGYSFGTIGTIIGVVVGIIVMVSIAKWYRNKMMALSRKKLGGMGKRKQLSRMSEKEVFKRDKNNATIGRIIGKLFGL